MKKEFSKVRHSMQGAFNFWVMFFLKWPDAIGQKLVCLENYPRGLL